MRDETSETLEQAYKIRLEAETTLLIEKADAGTKFFLAQYQVMIVRSVSPEENMTEVLETLELQITA